MSSIFYGKERLGNCSVKECECKRKTDFGKERKTLSKRKTNDYIKKEWLELIIEEMNLEHGRGVSPLYIQNLTSCDSAQNPAPCLIPCSSLREMFSIEPSPIS